MRALAFLSLVACTALSQQTEPAPRFDVADVHATPLPSSHSFGTLFMRGPFMGGGRYQVHNATMLDLVQLAYDFPQNKILGGPSWLDRDRFEISAKAPRGTTAETMKVMLQNLLAERFSLALHKDIKPLPTYALTVGKKPQLKEADGSGETGCKPLTSSGAPGPGGGRVMTMGANGVVTTINIGADGTIQFACRNITMAAFAEGLSRMMGVGNALGDNPVRDETGIKGTWNFDVKWSLGFRRPMADTGEQITVFNAVEKQLGLKLEQKQLPTPVLVVDSANQHPTPNADGVTQSLPPLPTEFEVADIKPAAPQMMMMMRYQIQPGGRVNIQGMTLKNLIEDAWDLPSDMVVGGPKSLDTDRWDIVAKAPTFGAEPESSSGPPAAPSRFQSLDQDAVNIMLRNLLIDRFQLKVHTEDRPVNAFTLTAVKPKLKKADPSNRTGFHEGPGPDGKDPRITNPLASRLVSCQNMTMAQLAENLPRIASGYIQGSNVIDATGLEGAYDFTLNFSVAGMATRPMAGGGGRGGDIGAGTGEASDPGGAITLSEALEKQLGLKLETTKRPAPVLVIDSVNAKPTDN